MAANPEVDLKKDYVMHLETTYRVSAPDHDHVKIEAVPQMVCHYQLLVL